MGGRESEADDPPPLGEAGTRRPRRASLRELAVGGGHLAVLSAFAVAQPLFDLLSRNAEFFAVRGSTSSDIILFALAVTLIPPAALLLVELLAGLVDARLRRGLHLVFVAALAATFAVQVLKRSVGLGSTTALILAAALLGIGLAIAYRALRPVRSILTVLTPAPLLFLALFLFVSPVSKVAFAAEADTALADVAAQTPIVLLVLDELPINSLLDGEGRIDAVRYPHFAALAGRSTWFRNTTTVSTSTTRAVPAILTGKYPRKGQLPIPADHPKNLFTLLGADYRLNVFESQTRLCPPELCRNVRRESTARRVSSLYSDVGVVYLHLVAPPELEARLAPVSNKWMNFGADEARIEELVQQAALTSVRKEKKKGRFYEGRVTEFERFRRSLRPSRSGLPALNFLHVLLPHGPWQYFPSGKQSALLNPAAPGREGDTWTTPWLTAQAHQRHLLQTAFVDRLLGGVIDRLWDVGLYDSSLVVVTADHGISFRTGDRRREVTATNIHDIAFVPLFVKRPGQRRGSVVDHHVQTIDILPTIADVLGVSLPWRVDGRSAFQPGKPRRVVVSWHPGGYTSLKERRDGTLARQLEHFGSGDDAPGIFGAGPHPELIGRPVGTLTIVGSAEATAEIDELAWKLLRSLPADAPFLPSPIQGRIVGDEARPGMNLAIAVNGRVAAVCRTFDSFGTIRFSGLVPESAFRPGANRVQLYWVNEAAGGLELRAVAATAA